VIWALLYIFKAFAAFTGKHAGDKWSAPSSERALTEHQLFFVLHLQQFMWGLIPDINTQEVGSQYRQISKRSARDSLPDSII